jgi:hypothetical protein
LTGNHGGKLKKSSDDVDFLAAEFAAMKLSPSHILPALVVGNNKGCKAKGAV